LLAELEQGEGGLRAPGKEGGVAAPQLLEAATGLEGLLEPPGQVAAQHAQTRAAVGKEEQAGSVGEGLAHNGAGEGSRGIVELALLHQGVGEKRQRMPREARRRRPRLAGGERLAGVGFRFGEVASHK
jgi:hypothetical protein